MAGILTITLNPAVDISATVDVLRPHDKLRTRRLDYAAGGGGINVARTATTLGTPSTAVTVLGGCPGDHFRTMATHEGIDLIPVEGGGTTRESFKIFETRRGLEYRFVPPGPHQPGEVGDAVMDRVKALLEDGDFAFIVLSGSFPPGLPDDIIPRLAELGKQRNKRVIVDTSGPPLKTAAKTDLFLIKPNIHEVSELADGRHCGYRAAARKLARAGNLSAVIVTLGRDGAYLATPEIECQFRPPAVEAVSTVGAGDTFIGALCHAITQDWALADACRLGVAAATAAVAIPATEAVKREDIHEFYDRVNAVP